MNYYISDHHFGHVRMNSDIDCRGFADVEAMDEYMIEQWNRKVNEKYIIKTNEMWSFFAIYSLFLQTLLL